MTTVCDDRLQVVTPFFTMKQQTAWSPTNIVLPVPMRVLFSICTPVAVDSLRCTTVPFTLALAIKLKVEVMSANLF